MKILVVNKYFFVSGGPERYMFSVIPLLEKNDHTVIPLALDLKRNQPSPYAHYFLPAPIDELVTHFKDFSPGWIEKIKLMSRAVYYSEGRRRVKDIVRQEGIELVYLLNICNYISPSVIDGAKEAGARVVMRLSDFNFVCASYHFFRNGRMCTACQEDGMHNAIRYRCMRDSLALSLARVLTMKAHALSGIYQKVDAFVAPSSYMAETLVSAGIPKERVHCIPSFVDLEQYQPRYEPGGYVLYLGRLDEEKGVDVLIRAWHLLGEDAPPLLIVGAGEAEASLKTLADTGDVRNIEFLGFAEKEQLIKLLRESAFVVAPSLWPDNSPMAVYEAMACGKAVVASKLGGLIDQIEDESSGLLLTPGEARPLAEAVKRLWEDPTLASKFGKQGRYRMENIFSPEEHIARLTNVFMN